MPPISQGGIDHAPNFSGSARSFAETLAVLNARVMIGKSGIIFGGTTSYARPRYLRSEPELWRSIRGVLPYQRRTARDSALVSEKRNISATCATVRRESRR